ncbi:hypothetical protein H0H92_000830, partial [Tricholoma furcatifolium]
MSDYETSNEAVPRRDSGASLPQEERPEEHMDEDRDKDRADGERYETIEAERDEDEDEDEDESIAPPRKRARTT